MDRIKTRWARVGISATVFLILCAGLGLAFQRIFAVSTPGLDLYISWVAGRAMLLEGGNPYSPEVTQAIQLGMHGRLPQPGEDPMRFAYPPYAILPILPLLWMTFDWTQAFWLSFNLLFLAVCLRSALPRAPLWILLVTFLYYPLAFGLILGNFAILITAILILCVGKLIFSTTQPSPTAQVFLGMLLAIVSIKPQFSWIFALAICIHAIRSRQWYLLAGLAGGLFLLLAFSFVVLPNWPSLWLSRLGEYTRDNPLYSPLHDYLEVFVPGSLLEAAIGFARIGILTLTLGLIYSWQRGYLSPVALLAWGGAAIYLLDSNGIAYDQILFLIPQIIWAGSLITRSRIAQIIPPLTALLTWLLFWFNRHGIEQASNRGTFLVVLPWIFAMFFFRGAKKV